MRIFGEWGIYLNKSHEFIHGKSSSNFKILPVSPIRHKTKID